MYQEKLKKRQLIRSLFKSNFLPLLEGLPKLTATPFIMRPNPDELAEFNALVGWADSSHLAPTWLQMRSMPTMLNLLTSPEFPFSPLGLVHLENNICIREVLPADADYVVQCTIVRYETHSKGVVVKARVEALLENQVVYQVDASFLVLIKAVVKPRQPGSQQFRSEILNDKERTWQLGTDIGRQYAKISGDYNLIHITPLTAKLFGFKRHIAHGMYLQARALSDILATGLIGESAFPTSISTAFKKPVFLPAKITLGHSQLRTEKGTKFELYSGATLHATGTIK